MDPSGRAAALTRRLAVGRQQTCHLDSRRVIRNVTLVPSCHASRARSHAGEAGSANAREALGFAHVPIGRGLLPRRAGLGAVSRCC